MKGFFILGTDTNSGKTTIALNLLSFLKTRGYSTVGLKPVSSGAKWTTDGLRNADAVALQTAATHSLSYSQVNPFCFRLATAPPIAVVQSALQPTVSRIAGEIGPLLNLKKDYYIIEGFGGAAVPLNRKETMLDLLQVFDLPVILVVGLRLGCLNHALLTYEVLKKRNISIVACIANQIDPKMQFYEENGLYLSRSMKIPFFSLVPYQEKKIDIDIDWSRLINTV